MIGAGQLIVSGEKVWNMINILVYSITVVLILFKLISGSDVSWWWIFSLVIILESVGFIRGFIIAFKSKF